VIRHAKASSAGSNSSKGRGESRLRSALLLCSAIVFALALSASPALADETHPFTGTSFGPDGTSASSFSGLSGVATDPANGDVYAYDSGAGKIYKFDSAGHPVNFSSLGTNAIEGAGGSGSGLDQIAIAPPGSPAGTAGDIYVAHYPELTVYGPSGAKLGEITGIGQPCGVTTDPAGHVLVGIISPEVVREYVPSANPFDPNTDQTGASTAELREICNVGADGLGDVYAANYEGRGIYRLEGLEAEEAPKVDPKANTLAIDPSSNDLYASRGSSVSQYDSSGALINSFGAGRLSGESGGIALNASGEEIYVGNRGLERVDVFGPLATVPTVTSKAAIANTPSKATLNATVNPDGLAVTNCEFEYGTSTEYGQTAPCEGAIPPDSADHAVSAQLSGLQGNTTYHFRVAATNANATNRSEDLTFTTANYAVTGEATNITGTKATLNGVVFPAGEAITECFFEYHNIFSSPKTVPCEGGVIPADEGEHAISAAITHLHPDGSSNAAGSYSFRLVINRGGTVEGEVKSFATATTVITGPATAIDPPTATIEGTVNPEGIPYTECKFEYGIKSLDESVPCTETPGEIGEGNSPVTVHANLSGLVFATPYSYRLVATNVDGSVTARAAGFNTPDVPRIETQYTSGVTETEAELIAKINPKGLATTYHLEYGTTASYGQSTAEAEVGADETSHSLTTKLQGLAPDTTYHWRTVATNSHGTTTGKDSTFTTLAPFSPETGCANQALRGGASAALPDCRAYELVSPAKKEGEVIPPDPNGFLGSSCGAECLPGGTQRMMPMQSTPDGEAMVYTGQPFSAGLHWDTNGYLAHRTASGWISQSLNPAQVNGQYLTFSSDLSHGVLSQASPTLSPEAPKGGEAENGYPNLYLRSADGSLQPTIAAAPPHRSPFEFRLVYGGANSGTPSSPAYGHAVFAANDTLTGPTATAPAPVDGGAGNSSELTNANLYEWFNGQLRLINVAPDNTETAPGAVIGSGHLVEGPSQFQAPVVDHAVSADGSRIFWSEESTGQVFVRIDGKETKKIEDPGKFLTASADGSKVLLDDGCLYDLANEECEEDLFQGQGEKFQGILGAAEDLSRVYFVDTAVLTGGEENANHEHAKAEGFNLYAWHGGVTTFVGTVQEGDNRVAFKYGLWLAALQNRSAQVSPDGRYLAFMSRAPLTGYDSTPSDGECLLNQPPACFEVFEYDADSGSLGCASCNPSGEQPLGTSNLSLLDPGNTKSAPVPQPANLSTNGEGRLFFESQDTLSPRDLNGHIQDVYEWRPDGVGGCQRAIGCIALISSGTSANDSMFVNSTPSGNDAFFITRQQLVLRDKDQLLDLYDARVGGGIDENPPPPCLGEACKGPGSSATEQQSPGSASFAGPGNEKPKKTKKHKHKKKHKHAHKHKKAHKRAAKHNRGGQK
jgi:hypothetical protein